MPLPPESRKSLVVGAAIVVAGLILLYVGLYVVGPIGTTGAEIGAGVITLVGITALLLSFFMYLLPPFLPAR